MTKTPEFADFLRCIRAGDDAAALELVQRYEPLIRREVRLRIGDDRLNRAFDSLDVSQSVFAQFFSRASTGEYQFDRPEQLARLLVTMARNRLITRVRRERRLVRDVRRLAVEQCLLEQVADTRPSPSEILSRKEAMELLKRANRRRVPDFRTSPSWPRLGRSRLADRRERARAANAVVTRA